MKSRLSTTSAPLFLGCAVLATCILAGCTSPVPHRIVRKTDIVGYEVNDASHAPHVLIASRASDYKETVVRLVGEALGDEGAYVKVVGVEALKTRSAEEYGAVLALNTAMAWTMDPDVRAFVDRFPENDRIVVFTTSGDGGWLPDDESDEAYDAVSGASVMADAQTKAAELVDLIRALAWEATSNDAL